MLQLVTSLSGIVHVPGMLSSPLAGAGTPSLVSHTRITLSMSSVSCALIRHCAWFRHCPRSSSLSLASNDHPFMIHPADARHCLRTLPSIILTSHCCISLLMRFLAYLTAISVFTLHWIALQARSHHGVLARVPGIVRKRWLHGLRAQHGSQRKD